MRIAIFTVTFLLVLSARRKAKASCIILVNVVARALLSITAYASACVRLRYHSDVTRMNIDLLYISAYSMLEYVGRTIFQALPSRVFTVNYISIYLNKTFSKVPACYTHAVSVCLMFVRHCECQDNFATSNEL